MKRDPEIIREYDGAQITNVHRGKGDRSVYVYAKLISRSGELLINATLDYIVQTLAERLPEEMMIAQFDPQIDAIRESNP